MPNSNKLNVPFGQSAGAGSAKRALTYINNAYSQGLTLEDDIFKSIINQGLDSVIETITAWVCGNNATLQAINLNNTPVNTSSSGDFYYGNGCGTLGYFYTVNTLLKCISLGNYNLTEKTLNTTQQGDGNILVTFNAHMNFSNIVIPTYTNYFNANISGSCFYGPKFVLPYSISVTNTSITLSGVTIPITLSYVSLTVPNIPNSLESYKGNIIPINLVKPIISFDQVITYPEQCYTETGETIVPITQCYKPIEVNIHINTNINILQNNTTSTTSSIPFIKVGNYYGIFATNINITLNTSQNITWGYLTLCSQYPSHNLGINNSYDPGVKNVLSDLFNDIFGKINTKFNNKMIILSEYCFVDIYTCVSSSNCYNCSLTGLSGKNYNFSVPNNWSPQMIYDTSVWPVSVSEWYNIFLGQYYS